MCRMRDSDSKGELLFMSLNFSKVEFVRSAAGPEGFLRDGLPQAAFAGRSYRLIVKKEKM